MVQEQHTYPLRRRLNGLAKWIYCKLSLTSEARGWGQKSVLQEKVVGAAFTSLDKGVPDRRVLPCPWVP